MWVKSDMFVINDSVVFVCAEGGVEGFFFVFEFYVLKFSICRGGLKELNSVYLYF